MQVDGKCEQQQISYIVLKVHKVEASTFSKNGIIALTNGNNAKSRK